MSRVSRRVEPDPVLAAQVQRFLTEQDALNNLPAEGHSMPAIYANSCAISRISLDKAAFYHSKIRLRMEATLPTHHYQETVSVPCLKGVREMVILRCRKLITELTESDRRKTMPGVRIDNDGQMWRYKFTHWWVWLDEHNVNE
ncbi:hypothetical protein HDU76_014118, partial [Blyttiomyces sp. JEL0837]